MSSRLLSRNRSSSKGARFVSQHALVNASSNPRLAEPPSPSPSTSLHCTVAPIRKFHTTLPAQMKPKKTGLPRKHDRVAPAPFYLGGDPPPYCRTCGRIMRADSPDNRGESERKYCSASCRKHKPRGTDLEIEKAFVHSLNDTQGNTERKLVSCDEIQELLFGMNDDAPATASGENLGQIRSRQREKVRQAARRGVVFGFAKDDGLERWPKCEAVQEERVVEPSFAKGNFSVRWRE